MHSIGYHHDWQTTHYEQLYRDTHSVSCRFIDVIICVDEQVNLFCKFNSRTECYSISCKSVFFQNKFIYRNEVSMNDNFYKTVSRCTGAGSQGGGNLDGNWEAEGPEP